MRLRPILMTSLAAVAGLAPLAFGIGAGGQMQQPLAIAILGGVSLSMLFSLIGVPLLYLLLARPAAARSRRMRLLVVEDEQTLARYLQTRAAKRRRGRSTSAQSVDDAWRLLLLNPYDLIVLDLGLPGADGSELLRRLREAGMDTPVLILTARGAVEDRVAGLNAGADDYLAQAVCVRRAAGAHPRAAAPRARARDRWSLRVGDLQLDVAAPAGAARRAPHRAHRARVQRAGVSHAPRRRGGDAHACSPSTSGAITTTRCRT